jgi:hypothetical protein
MSLVNYSHGQTQGLFKSVRKNVNSDHFIADWQISNKNVSFSTGVNVITLKYRHPAKSPHSFRQDKIRFRYTIRNNHPTDAVAFMPPIYFQLSKVSQWYGKASQPLETLDDGLVRFNYLNKLSQMIPVELDHEFAVQYGTTTTALDEAGTTWKYNFPSIPALSEVTYELDLCDILENWRYLNFDQSRKVDLKIDLQLISSTSDITDAMDVTGGAVTLNDIELKNIECYSLFTRFASATVPRPIVGNDVFFNHRYEIFKESSHSLDTLTTQRFQLENYFKVETHIQRLFIWVVPNPQVADQYNSYESDKIESIKLFANGTELQRELYSTSRRIDDIIFQYSKNVQGVDHQTLNELNGDYWRLRNPMHGVFIDYTEVAEKMPKNSIVLSGNHLRDTAKLEVELTVNTPLNASDRIFWLIEYIETWRQNNEESFTRIR